MQRIVIVGTTGSGKTTLANSLSQKLNIPHIEVDSLYWLSDWKERPREETRAILVQMLAQPGWVIDGNYSFMRDLMWGQADTLIWLDYSLFVSQWRLFWRTLRRIQTQELLWGVNREHFRNQFLSTDSLFWWAVTSRRKHHREYPRLFQQAEYNHLKVFRFHSPRETEAWLTTCENHQGITG